MTSRMPVCALSPGQWGRRDLEESRDEQIGVRSGAVSRESGRRVGRAEGKGEPSRVESSRVEPRGGAQGGLAERDAQRFQNLVSGSGRTDRLSRQSFLQQRRLRTTSQGPDGETRLVDSTASWSSARTTRKKVEAGYQCRLRSQIYQATTRKEAWFLQQAQNRSPQREGSAGGEGRPFNC